MYRVIVSLVLFYIVSVIHGQTIDDAYRLHTYLFNSSRYNKNVRPVLNQSEPLTITITQALSSLESLDITYGFAEVSGYLHLSWQDEMLIWDPASYGDIQMVPLPQESYWKPDTSMLGIAKAEDPLWTTKYDLAVVDSNGSVVLFIYANVVTKCKIDTTLFPFDSHECNFQFYFPKHLDSVELQTTSSHVQRFLFVDNFEWEIGENSSQIVPITDASSTYITYRYESRITFKRRPTFIILHQFLPSFTLVILNVLTCIVPLNSGERLSYSVTILLAYTFLMGTMVEQLPASSLNISLASYSFVTVNTMNSMTVVWSVICIRLSLLDTETYRIPKWLRTIVRKKSILVLTQTHTVHPLDTVQDNIDGNTENVISGKVSEKSDKRTTKVTPLEDESRQMTKVVKENDKSLTWFEVATFLDKLYFIVFIVVTVIITAISLGFVIKQKLFH